MSHLSETELKVFIDAVSHYFAQLTREPAVIRSSYLPQAELPHFDYTGLITLSGHFRGFVYFSAPRRLMRELLVQMHEPDVCEQNLLDAVGEVANTISGNARRHFGGALDISVPIAIKGAAQVQSTTATRPFAILLTWERHEAVVVVDLATA
ncbi:MAG: chemotaxis protein CheX [Pseudomonadota bacterium]